VGSREKGAFEPEAATPAVDDRQTPAPSPQGEAGCDDEHILRNEASPIVATCETKPRQWGVGSGLTKRRRRISIKKCPLQVPKRKPVCDDERILPNEATGVGSGEWGAARRSDAGGYRSRNARSKSPRRSRLRQRAHFAKRSHGEWGVGSGQRDGSMCRRAAEKNRETFQRTCYHSRLDVRSVCSPSRRNHGRATGP